MRSFNQSQSVKENLAKMKLILSALGAFVLVICVSFTVDVLNSIIIGYFLRKIYFLRRKKRAKSLVTKLFYINQEKKIQFIFFNSRLVKVPPMI